MGNQANQVDLETTVSQAHPELQVTYLFLNLRKISSYKMFYPFRHSWASWTARASTRREFFV